MTYQEVFDRLQEGDFFHLSGPARQGGIAVVVRKDRDSLGYRYKAIENPWPNMPTNISFNLNRLDEDGVEIFKLGGKVTEEFKDESYDDAFI